MGEAVGYALGQVLVYGAAGSAVLGIVGFTVRAVLTGSLVPRSSADKNSEAFRYLLAETQKDRDLWREAYREADAARRVLLNAMEGVTNLNDYRKGSA